MYKKYLIWYFICSFIISVCYQEELPDVTLIKYNNTLKCTTTNSDYGLAWIQPINKNDEYYESEYFPQEARYPFYETEYWNQNKWVMSRSIYKGLSYLKDERWEGLKTTYTNNAVKAVVNITNDADVSIPFSVRVSKDAHLYLCDSDDPFESNCYWIVIGGYVRTRSFIRKCQAKQILQDFKAPNKETCRKFQDMLFHESSPVNENRWNHFYLKYNKHQITVNFTSSNFSLIVAHDKKGLDIKYLIVGSPVEALWKIHDYTFYKSEENSNQKGWLSVYIHENCMTFFTAMCSKCQIQLYVYNDIRNILTTTITPNQDLMWQTEKFFFDESDMWVHMHLEKICNNCSYPFWAIDKIRSCSKNETRALTLQDPKQKVSCQVIGSSLDNLKLTDVVETENDWKCPLDTIGSKCIKCETVLNSPCNWIETTVCEYTSSTTSTCRCSSGYVGKKCRKKCPDNYYGFGCKEKCGTCALAYSCNTINGFCPQSTCIGNFIAPMCKINKYPILFTAAEVEEITHRSIRLKIPSYEESESEKPVNFKITCKNQKDNGYTNSTVFNLIDNKFVTVHDLQPETTYEIKIILYTKENNSYEGVKVPSIYNTTTCEFLNIDNIEKHVTNISATILYRDTEDSCKLQNYKIYFNNSSAGQSLQINNTYKKLEPYTNYSIVINHSKIIDNMLTFTIRTAPGVSTPITSMTTVNLNPTEASFMWNKPEKPHGMIGHYKIEYWLERYNACNSNFHGSEKYVRNETTESLTIFNLIPYSSYILKIQAVTVIEGEIFEMKFHTPENDLPEESEIPEIEDIKPQSTGATVLLKFLSCNLLKGSIVTYVNVTCENEWCSTSNVLTFNSSTNQIHLTNLLPYSKYVITHIIASRKNHFTYKQQTRVFYTLEGVPNKIMNFIIYSKTSKSASLRISKPYPPNGILKSYGVNICQYGKCDLKTFAVVECKLWNNNDCLTIQHLNENNYYSISVTALNENVKEGNYSNFKALHTQESASSPPYNIYWDWDEYYNITLHWNHPNITNGPLTKFDVHVTTEMQTCYLEPLKVNEKNYTLVYTYTVPLKNEECHAKYLTIKVCPINTIVGECASVVRVKSPPATPKFNVTPYGKSNTNTTITLEIPIIHNFVNESFLYIIVFEYGQENNDLINTILNGNENSQIFSKTTAVLRYNDVEKLKTITLGENNTNLLKNENIKPNTTYLIQFLLYTKNQNFSRHMVYNVFVTTIGDTIISPNQNGYIALIVLVLIPVIIWIVIRKRKRIFSETNRWIQQVFKTNPVDNNPHVLIIPLENKTRKPRMRTVPAEKVKLKPKILEPTNFEEPKILNDTFSKPIKITDFEEYVKEALKNEELDKQYQLFSRGPQKSIEYGSLPQNKKKNRYINLIAYDYSRVILEKIENDPYSDYINANYINGYKTKNAYIATQGPKLSTVNDFWRMIWQEDVKYIIMLANVYEGGKKKVEQYWPNIELTEMYGNIKVTFVSTQIYADYEHRSFTISKDDINRQVQQLHFVSWPDHGVPLYSQSLVPLLKKLLQIPPRDFPVVIHCSAGVGRTGTIILCDICLRMAAQESTVDIFKYQHHIREQRINMVDNIHQYKLVHLALLEILVNPDTSIPTNAAMEETILKLINSDAIKQQLQFINDVAWQDEIMDFAKTFQPHELLEKNRFEDIVPGSSSRVFLSRYPVTDEYSDYINAVEVSGFKCPQKFIATQQPLPNTVSDFWRMIDEKNVKTIVSLNMINNNNNKSCVFWPTSKIREIQPLPFILVKLLDKTKHEDFDIISIILHNTKNQEHTQHTVKLLIPKNWSSDQMMPESISSLVTLWSTTDKLSNGEIPIVVTCFDGATACGLFIGLSFVIEKIKLEQQCDVCLAIRTIRRSRYQFVQSLEQLIFLYKASICYLSSFELYSNFIANNKEAN